MLKITRRINKPVLTRDWPYAVIYGRLDHEKGLQGAGKESLLLCTIMYI